MDKDTWFDVYADYVVTPEGRDAFMKDRQACMVGRALAKRFGFKVGDRIPLRGTIWGGDWEFNIVGVYDGNRPEADTTGMFFRADYLEENRQFGKGTVGWYVVKLRDPEDAVQVTKAIDALFANSPFETLTQTEKAFAASFVKQMGNIELLILTIGAVVFFTLLLVTGNTMAIAVRERSGELAVLKTVGFSDLARPGAHSGRGRPHRRAGRPDRPGLGQDRHPRPVPRPAHARRAVRFAGHVRRRIRLGARASGRRPGCSRRSAR